MRMKKLLSVLLVAAMLASMAVTAFAEGETTVPATELEPAKTTETVPMENIVPAGDAGIALTAGEAQTPSTDTWDFKTAMRFAEGPASVEWVTLSGVTTEKYSTIPDLNYHTEYEKAGITIANNTVTVDEAKFRAYVAAADSKFPYLMNAKNLFLGITFPYTTDASFTPTKVSVNGGQEIALNPDSQNTGTDIVDKQLIIYYHIASADDSDPQNITWTMAANGEKNYELVWKDDNGNSRTSTGAVTRVITPVGGGDEGGDSGSSGSGSSSSDSSSGSSSAAAPSANVDSKGAVSAVRVNSDAKKAVSNAKNGTANVNVTNAKTVDSAALNAMAKTAAKEDVALTMTAKTTDRNGNVVATLKFDTAEAAKAVAAAEVKEVKLGVELNTKNTKNVTSLFKKWFKNKNIVTVKMAQKGEFGFNVAATVKVDLKKFNKDTLHFYSYDAATNTYKEINTKYTIDAKGLVHFNTTVGNYIIVTDAPIASK